MCVDTQAGIVGVGVSKSMFSCVFSCFLCIATLHFLVTILFSHTLWTKLSHSTLILWLPNKLSTKTTAKNLTVRRNALFCQVETTRRSHQPVTTTKSRDSARDSASDSPVSRPNFQVPVTSAKDPPRNTEISAQDEYFPTVPTLFFPLNVSNLRVSNSRTKWPQHVLPSPRGKRAESKTCWSYRKEGSTTEGSSVNLTVWKPAVPMAGLLGATEFEFDDRQMSSWSKLPS